MTARFAPAAVLREPRPGGGFVLRSPVPEWPSVRCIGDWLVHWAREAPDRTFLAERAGAGWRRVGYREAWLACAGSRRPARRAGSARPRRSRSSAATRSITRCSRSPRCTSACRSRRSRPRTRWRRRISGSCARSIAQLAPGAVCGRRRGVRARLRGARRAALRAVARGARHASRRRRRSRASRPTTVAKILFTSGSTGTPKGVVNTQRMLCANQAAHRRRLAVPRRAAAGDRRLAAVEPHVRRQPQLQHDPRARRHALHRRRQARARRIRHDAREPARGLADALLQRAARLRHARRRRSRRDDELRATFFRELDVVFYAAAALRRRVGAARGRGARRAGRQLAMVSAWGSTETAPLVTQVHFPIDRAGVIGLPAPGLELKFAPVGEKLELRVRGPERYAGLLDRRRRHRAAPRRRARASSDGRRRQARRRRASPSGRRLRRAHRRELQAHLGTWVHVGELRIALVAACSPLVADAVMAGHDRDEVGALVFAAPGQRARRPACSPRRLARCNAGPRRIGRADRARARPRRAAVDRRRRDHRQGLHQPARRPRAPRRRGRCALRR